MTNLVHRIKLSPKSNELCHPIYFIRQQSKLFCRWSVNILGRMNTFNDYGRKVMAGAKFMGSTVVINGISPSDWMVDKWLALCGR